MRFKWLYSLQKEDNLKVFVRNPPGKLSIARLLRQMPAFEQRRVGETPKPSDIIVNIWTKHLDPVAVKRKIVELMQQGHKVTLASNLSLPLSEEWIESGEINFSRDETRPFYRYLGLPEHRTHILTHYDMERLLHDDEKLQTSTVMANDFLYKPGFNPLNGHSEDILHGLNPIGASCKNEKTKLIYQSFPDPERAKTSQITTHVICTTFHSNYEWSIGADMQSKRPYTHLPRFITAILRDEDISELLEGRELVRKPCNFKPEYLENLTSLGYILPPARPDVSLDEWSSYYDYTNPEKAPAAANMAELLRHTPNLEHLLLGRMASASNTWPSLPRLRKLTVGYVTNTASFFRLLEQSPALEELKMYHSLPPEPTDTLRPLVSVKRYKELRKPDRLIDGNMRFKLLQAMPNL